MSHFPGEKGDTKKSATSRSRQDDVLQAADVLGPGSPAGAGADQQASSASQQEIAAIAVAPEMSADMQKFITFAGRHCTSLCSNSECSKYTASIHQNSTRLPYNSLLAHFITE